MAGGIEQVGRQWAGASCPSAELCPERSVLSRKEHLPHSADSSRPAFRFPLQLFSRLAAIYE